jgi:hypothetical protein
MDRCRFRLRSASFGGHVAPPILRAKKTFNGDGAVVSYLDMIWTRGADDMSDHEKWVSYSHWGMFALKQKSSRPSN